MRRPFTLGIGLLLSLLLSPTLSAQEPIGLRINTLSSAERDAIITNVREGGELRVIYACVPAGVIVFSEATPSGSREALRTKVISAIAPIIPAGRIAGTDYSLDDAETACETVRGQ